MTRVYLSFRSEDLNVVRPLYQRAVAAYGKNNIIVNPEYDELLDMSLDEYLKELIAACDVVFLVIGQHWTGLDEFGRFLLSSADVPVGSEVAAAFSSPTLIVPVLVNGVKALPPPDEVPEEFHRLYATAPVILRPEHLSQDMQRLIDPPSLIGWLQYALSLVWLFPLVKPRLSVEDEAF